MKLLKEHEYKTVFEIVNPHLLIAPFGLKWGHKPTCKTLVITTKSDALDFANENYFVRTHENCHAKLAIGTGALLTGSWNWSLEHDTKARNREIVIYIEKENTVYNDLVDWFEEMWLKSTPWEKPTDKIITKLHEVL